MKLWLKYTLSSILGIFLAYFLPEIRLIDTTVYTIGEFSLRMGRFLIFPLLFFTLPVAVCQLRREKTLFSTMRRLIFMSLLTCFLFMVVTILLFRIIPTERVPIIIESETWQSVIPFRNELFLPTLKEQARLLLPINFFNIFNSKADALLPALLFAFVLGAQLSRSREEAEPLYNVFDSSGRMFYYLTELFSTLLTLSLFSLSFESLRHIKTIPDLSSYSSFIILALVVFLILFCVVLPLSYYLITKRNPLHELPIVLPAIIVSSFSGDPYFNLIPLIHGLREGGGVKRKISGVVLPFMALFSRPGTAAITAISMLTILKSYSSLELTFFQYLLVGGSSILVSFTLFSQSYLGVYVALITTMGFYGRGTTEAYVHILPVLPILGGLATLLDSTTAAYMTLFFGTDGEAHYYRDQRK